MIFTHLQVNTVLHIPTTPYLYELLGRDNVCKYRSMQNNIACSLSLKVMAYKQRIRNMCDKFMPFMRHIQGNEERKVKMTYVEYYTSDESDSLHGRGTDLSTNYEHQIHQFLRYQNNCKKNFVYFGYQNN